MSKTISYCEVIESGRLAPDVFSMWLDAGEIAANAKAGQFVSLYPRDGAHLLPRPISICEIDEKGGRLRLVYRVAGYGTDEFSRLSPGSIVRVMGPLGNGFPVLENINKNRKNTILIGGGIGIPPMLSVAKDIRNLALDSEDCKITTVLGYRDRHIFLSDDLYELSDVLLTATDDGSRGTHGTVIDALDEWFDPEVPFDVPVGSAMGASCVVYACGPMPMLRGVKTWASEHGMAAWVSMEERMACGIGACLGCVCKSVDTDEHSQVNNKRVCADGPVFNADEVLL